MDARIEKLFTDLHNNPECSLKEYKSEKIIKEFIKENTDFSIFDMDGGFYAYCPGINSKKALAFRADIDAVTTENGPKHLCGHDGHSAALCAFGLLLMKKRCENDIYLLFQKGEENGQGAKLCLDIFKNDISEIYGCHNLPGYKFGEIYTRTGCFAPTSCGLILKYKGKAAHCCNPDEAISPCLPIARIIEMANEYNSLDPLKLVTVNGAFIGNKGASLTAKDGEVYLTLRCQDDKQLEKMKQRFTDYSLTCLQGLQFSYEIYDYFPATINHDDCVEKLVERCQSKLLTRPMNWSEDFGYYLQDHNGAFFGIGAGEQAEGLHTKDYCYNKDLIDKTADVFYALAS